jgi:hypothetical protein
MLNHYQKMKKYRVGAHREAPAAAGRLAVALGMGAVLPAAHSASRWLYRNRNSGGGGSPLMVLLLLDIVVEHR